MLFQPFHARPKRRQRQSGHSDRPRYAQHRYRRLGFQRLERRELLSAVSLYDSADFTTLASLSTSTNTGEKPQSKVWEYADRWWSVLPNSSGTWLWRLDGTTWDPMLKLSSKTGVHADVRAAGDLAHVLLYSGTASQYLTLKYSAELSTGYTPWLVQPNTVNVSLSSGVETATIDVDGMGRLWLASDASSTVEVRYSDYPYKSFSNPITIASGISSDDISTIAALPSGAVGVLWSNQSADRFGFRLHLEGDSPTAWLTNEVPASQSARSTGGGMADDHLNMAVASDGTVYAAVKTSYDSSSYAKIGLLVRRPTGNWDSLYTVSTSGTRPIVALNERANRLIVAYTQSESGGDVLFRESSMDVISFGSVHTLISGSVNNVTSTKGNFTDELVVLAGSSSKVYGSLLAWPGLVDPPPVDPPPPPPVDPPVSEPTTISLRDGLNSYAGTQDASILAKSANTNRGTATELQADGSPDEAALIRWDLRSITPGSEIQSATIALNVTNTTSQTYEIYELKRAWSETQTTWNQAASGTAWQKAGAQGAQDRGTTVLGTVTGSSTGTVKIVLNKAGLEVFQRWINQPGSNFGLIIQDYTSATNGVMFSSSEASSASLRPTLTVSYVPQPGPLYAADSQSTSAPQAPALASVASAQDEPAQVGLPLAAGLAGSWQLDETSGTKAADVSGLGNDGAIQGGPTRVGGRSGNALQLDGADDRVVVPDSPSLDARQAITIAAWLKPEKTATQYVVKKADRGAIDGYELSLSGNGTVFVRLNNASAGDKYRVDSQTHYAANGSTWIHAAATYDGSTIKLYINGKLESSLAASFTIGANDLALGIGAQADGYRPMQGAIDDVRIYTRALSAAEIGDLARV